jgi:hypothetical protein
MPASTPRFAVPCSLFCGLAVAACQGTVGGGDSSGRGSAAEDLGRIQVQVVCTDTGSAAPAPIRRLTNREYARSVQAMLGVAVDDLVADFPPDKSAVGFDNDVLGQELSTLRVSRYESAAQEIASRFLANASLRNTVIACDIAQNACVEAFTTRLLRRAYRRPPEPNEVSDLLALGNTGATLEGTHDARISYIVQGVLLSPTFLLRPEVGANGPDDKGRVLLSGHEIASRLSYLLWGEPPDDALLDRADQGELSTREGILAVAVPMMDDPRTKAHFREFYEQWLWVDSLDTAQPDAMLFPEFTETLRNSMKAEVQQLVDEFLWGTPRNVFELFTTNTSYINDSLATLYGLGATGSTTVQATSLPASSNRAGVLTTAALLTVTSKPRNTSIMKRGHFVRDFLLCEPIRLPPGFSVTPLQNPDPNQTENEALLAHASKPECAGCHNLMDPIGKGFERYNAIGKYHETDDQGDPIPEGGSVAGLQNPAFANVVELGQRLATDPKSQGCFSQQLMRWALARTLDMTSGSADACTTQTLQQTFQGSNHHFRVLLENLIGSDAFRYRTYDAP